MVNFKDLLPVAVGLLVISITLSVSSEILDDRSQDFVTGTSTVNTSIGCNATVRNDCGYVYNITERGLIANEELSTWLQLIALVFAAAIVIGVIFQSFGGFAAKR